MGNCLAKSKKPTALEIATCDCTRRFRPVPVQVVRFYFECRRRVHWVGESFGLPGDAGAVHRGEIPASAAEGWNGGGYGTVGGEGDAAAAQEHKVAHREDGEVDGGSKDTWEEEDGGSGGGKSEDGAEEVREELL
ncbi:hypothetical protein F3Y22_tig00000340pilonHSYRG01474 [Hibiscus syriacus]|uniref:Uncharacterized protein n=1 Tax=Hibiscus syriacus TaxID=106335 RepID=A0A6A3D934_HIBSY|nr:hypothetical protein F3Y22_tig00000340pilonHSYRG01474 [Hibiscus syriacus]